MLYTITYLATGCAAARANKLRDAPPSAVPLFTRCRRFYCRAPFYWVDKGVSVKEFRISRGERGAGQLIFFLS